MHRTTLLSLLLTLPVYMLSCTHEQAPAIPPDLHDRCVCAPVYPETMQARFHESLVSGNHLIIFGQEGERLYGYQHRIYRELRSINAPTKVDFVLFDELTKPSTVKEVMAELAARQIETELIVTRHNALGFLVEPVEP